MREGICVLKISASCFFRISRFGFAALLLPRHLPLASRTRDESGPHVIEPNVADPEERSESGSGENRGAKRNGDIIASLVCSPFAKGLAPGSNRGRIEEGFVCSKRITLRKSPARFASFARI